ncbi:MAG: hypothetical protein KJO13_07150 [Gammaproteobacteria bacterium]|nr:hypothetical protein [Gammaproteobacteria bacterium]
MERVKVLYISCSSFSGSTLLSFLLNTHPRLVTIGHTTGWAFGEDEAFACSCGELLQECPFYRFVEAEYDKAGLPFDIRNFGTAYKLAENSRLNDILVGCPPKIRNSRLEQLRDNLVRRMPGWTTRLKQQDRANLVLMQAALDYAGADVYVDSSHRPHRLRQLAESGYFDLYVMHLVRDIRGVVLSHMKRRSWDPALATRVWLNEQANILRVSEEFPNRLIVEYDDLCDDVNSTLEQIHRFVSVEPLPMVDDFKEVDHHILGNQMRLGAGKIQRDTKWQRELSETDLNTITVTARDVLARSENPALTQLVSKYID